MANPTFERMPRRFRQALVVLVVVGTLFNAWTAIDAQLALPDYTAKATSEVRAAAALNRTMMAWDIAGAKARAQDRQFQEYCRQSGTTHNDPACSKEELPTPDPTYSSEEAIQRTIRERADGHYQTYTRPRLVAIWERAAKVEFALLAGAVFVWLILARPNAPRRES